MKNKNIKLRIINISIIMFIIFICAYVIYNIFFMNKYIIKDFNKDIVINYGDEFKPSQYICYGNKHNCVEVVPTIEGDVNTDELGKYTIKYTYKYKSKELILDQVIEVKDIQGPTIEVLNEGDIIACPNGKSNDLKLDIKDNYDQEITNITQRIEGNKIIVEAIDSNNNKTVKDIDVIVQDNEKPTININGNKSITHVVGVNYNDKGATVTDNCDDNLEIITSGTVNKDKVGTYTITYSATDSSGNKAEATRKVTVKEKTPGSRVIYLTFDDGPGAYTNQLLDVLKKYNVKATFFVTCKGDDAVIKREYDEGHTVALHTCSHDYASIYKNGDGYFKDLQKIQDRVERITGEKVYLIRFPGGSSNTTSRKHDGGAKIMSYLTKEVTKRGYKYFDWNVSSGDAGGTASSDGVYNNVTTYLKSGSSVVLQHDIKKYSVEAVERIIQYGQANGYTFERLTSDSPGAHHGVNN